MPKETGPHDLGAGLSTPEYVVGSGTWFGDIVVETGGNDGCRHSRVQGRGWLDEMEEDGSDYHVKYGSVPTLQTGRAAGIY